MIVRPKIPSKYFNKKVKVGKHKIDLSKYKNNNNRLNQLIDVYQDHVNNGFDYYDKTNFERMIRCYDDIDDFALQMIKLKKYNENSDKPSANTLEKFQILYGEKKGLEKWNNKIEKVRGKNNPWYNHDGKYSPWKKGSKNYNENSIKKATNNRSYNTRLDYYIDKGLTYEEALVALKNRQETFSLKKCIERHGSNKGKEIWKNRQIRWQNTLKSKTQEEIDDINKRKGSGIGRYLDRNIKGSLYYIHFFTEEVDFWKIGITSNKLDERFNFNKLEFDHHIYKEVKFFNEYDTIQQAYDEEQYILAFFEKNRVIIDIDGFYSTECFDIDILKGYYDETI